MTTATAPAPARLPVDRPISRELLEDRWAGGVEVEDEAAVQELYDRLNGALHDVAVAVSRNREPDALAAVIDVAWLAVRDAVISGIDERGLAR